MANTGLTSPLNKQTTPLKYAGPTSSTNKKLCNIWFQAARRTPVGSREGRNCVAGLAKELESHFAGPALCQCKNMRPFSRLTIQWILV